MLGISIEAYTLCPRCSARVHLNGLLEQFTCRACGRAIQVPLKHWKSLVDEAFAEAPAWGELQGRRARILFPHREYVVVRGRQDPTFRDSRTSMEMQAAEAAASVGFLVNPLTGAPASVRRLPAGFADLMPVVTHVVEEELDLLLAAGQGPAGLAAARPGKALEVGCSQCGGAIPLAQGARLVRCSYCDTVSFLADELYQHLNPDARARRFYLWTTLVGREDAGVSSVGEDPQPWEDERMLPAAEPLRDRAETRWVSLLLSHRCAHCSEPQALPALVPELACGRCGELNPLEPTFWASVLADLAEVAYRGEPGVTSQLTRLAGDRSFEATHCREAPSSPSMDGPPAPDDLDEAVARGWVGESGDGVPLRRVPRGLVSYLPGIEFLAGEPPELLATVEGGEGLWQPGPAAQPQAFSCPQCGGSLSVDGTLRVVVCPYCGSPAGLPQALWMKLHPPRVEHKWYLTYDPRSRIFGWRSNAHSAAMDAESNLYLLCDHDDYSTPLLVKLDRSLRRRWLVEVNLEDASAGSWRLTVCSDGTVLLWCAEEIGSGAVRRFRCADGRAVEGAGPGLERARSLVVDVDGSLLAWVRVGEPGSRLLELKRLAADGTEQRVWDTDKKSGHLLGQAWRLITAGRREPRLKEAGHRPRVVRDDRVLLAAAGEAGIFMHDQRFLYGFARDGQRKFRVETPPEAAPEQLLGTSDGRLYLLADEPRQLFEVSTVDGGLEPFITARDSGGGWGDERLAVIAPDGRVFAMGDEGQLRIFDREGHPRFANWSARYLDRHR